MKTLKLSLILCIIFFLASCDTTKKSQGTTDDGIIEVIFLQVNDVYEIGPLQGGTKGGMARVATLRNQLLKENINTLTVLSGDFLNPSVIGSLPLNDKENIKGKQMVDVMNHTGIDLVTFGNHEFDIKEGELQKRINESEFQWVSSNVLHKHSNKVESFYKIQNHKKEYIPESWIWEAKDADGTSIKIGVMSSTINSNPQDWVIYEDAEKEAIKIYNQLLPETDLIIGVTHLSIEQDMKLAAEVPDVALIMGGHEHVTMIHKVEDVVITKADANAKSAYVHRLKYNKKTKKIDLSNKLIQLDEKIPMNPKVNEVVTKWTKLADDKFSSMGFDPKEIIATLDDPLDGKETSIRYKQTNLGHLVTESMSEAVGNRNDCSIFNSGSFRLDDDLVGPVSQLDIIRTIPYGGKIYEVEMTGKLLLDVLNQGLKSTGLGAYLQWDLIDYNENTKNWSIQKKPLDTTKNYMVAINDFLLLGRDIPILKEGVAGIIQVIKPNKDDKADLRNDVRAAVVKYLKEHFN